MHPNRSAYVKSPWLFEVRDNPVSDPGPGRILLEIAACGVCGTDLHTADRMATDWQLFGHEMAGIVAAAGEGVTRFKVGDRIALNTAAPCGRCEICSPPPYGRGRPSQCRTVTTYWDGPHMGFGDFIVSPHECAVAVPDSLALDAASLAEPIGVSIDLVETGEVAPGDRVLIVGPGPLGLGAITAARHAGASHVALAGLTKSAARMQSGVALGADELIEVDKTSLTKRYSQESRKPDKILVTAPPSVLPECIEIAPFGGVIAYIGIAWGPGAMLTFDADKFHFQRLSLKASFASPDTQTAKSIRLLESAPELARELISHRFKLEDIGEAMTMARDDGERTIKKLVMVKPELL